MDNMPTVADAIVMGGEMRTTLSHAPNHDQYLQEDRAIRPGPAPPHTRIVHFDYGRIGIDVDNMLRITAVAQGSQAELMSVTEGDKIIALNGVPARGAIEQLMKEQGMLRADGSVRKVRDEFLKSVKAMSRPIAFQIVSVAQ
jgi:C-terminal processing protease CtpA/Prc